MTQRGTRSYRGCEYVLYLKVIFTHARACVTHSIKCTNKLHLLYVNYTLIKNVL